MYWDHDHALPPIDKTYYPEATSSSLFIRIPYSNNSVDPNYQMPITQMVYPGQLLRIKMTAPPGSTSFVISGKSNNWQGAGSVESRVRMGVFDAEPQGFTASERSGTGAYDGHLYLDDLAVAAGGLNMAAYYGGALTQAQDFHFILYNPSTGRNFQFVSLGFYITIKDTVLYKNWYDVQFNNQVRSGTSSGTTGLDLPSLGRIQGSAFFGGTSVNGGGYANPVTHTLQDQVNLRGAIVTNPSHVNQSADIFVYAKMGEEYVMAVNGATSIQPWDMNPATLMPFQSGVRLETIQQLDFFTGNFGGFGVFDLYYGYRLPSGVIAVAPQAMSITIR